MLFEAMQFEQNGVIPQGWTYEQIYKRYESTFAYRETGDKRIGNYYWFYERDLDFMPDVWWYYH
jgi:hypothetical protein